MRSVFQREDLWHLVHTPSIKTKSPHSDSSHLISPNMKGKKQSISLDKERLIATELDLLRRRNLPVIAYLRLSVTLEIRPKIQDIEDPMEAWQCLQTTFQTNTITNIMVVLNKWVVLRIHEKPRCIKLHVNNLFNSTGIITSRSHSE